MQPDELLCVSSLLQKVILKGNEAILKDNSQRSKWDVTGPGGLDMLVPSVCLIIPPPNPLSISLANKYVTRTKESLHEKKNREQRFLIESVCLKERAVLRGHPVHLESAVHQREESHRLAVLSH